MLLVNLVGNGTLQDETKDILPFRIPFVIRYKLMGKPMHKLYFITFYSLKYYR